MADGKEVGRISIRVMPNTKLFRAELKKDLEEIEKEFHPEIKFKANFDPADLRAKVAAAAKAAKAEVPVKIDAKDSSFLATLAEVKAAAKAADAKVDIDFRDREAEAKLAALIAKLKAEAKLARIKINVDVDRSLRGRLSQIGDGLGSLASGAASRVGGFFRSLSDDTTLLAVAITAFLAPALAVVTGLMVSLPAIIAGIAAPIGVLVLGFKGIKDAAEAAGLLGTEKGKGKNSKEKTTLGKALKDVQEQLSKTFKDGFTPIFKQLAGVLPQLLPLLDPIAQKIVGLAKSMTDVVTSGKGVQQIQQFFNNLAQAMQVATPGMAKFAEGMLGLIAGGSNSLPKFAQLFTKMGTSFSDWIAKITTPDKLDGKAFSSPLDRAIDGFINVLKTAGPIISDLFSKAFDFLSDPKKVHQMMDFLNDFRQFVNGLFDVSAGIFQVVSNIFNWLKNAGDEVSKLRDKVTKNWDSIFGGGVLNGIGTSLQESIGAALNGLGAAFSATWSGIWAGVKAAGSLAISGWKTELSTIWEGVTSAAQTAWATITGVVQTTISAWGNFFVGIWDGLVQSASGVWAQIQQIFQANLDNVFSPIKNAASGAWNGIVETARDVWGQVVTTVSGAVDNITNLAGSIPGKIAGFFTNAAGLLVSAGQAMMDGLLSGIRAGAQAVYDFVSGIAGKIAALKGPLPYDRKVLVPNGQALMGGLQDGLEGGLQGVLDRAKSIAEQISDAMKNGLVPPGLKDQLKRELSELGVQYDQLRVQKDALAPNDKAGRAVLSDQMKQVQTIRDQLRLQSDQLGFSDKYGNNQNNITEQLGQQLGKMVDIGKSFGMANLTQFEQDLGMSGSGAIPTIANIGVDWLSSTLSSLISGGFGGGTTYNVGNVDEAIRLDRNRRNTAALSVAGR